jgi:catechol 2,3-dioxygenase-like lactoylglutathione lyase family enzyme
MNSRLEHANVQVRNVDAAIRFITTALPDFRVRHDSGGAAADRWVHVGTDASYIALSQSTVEPSEPWVPYSGRPGVNHLAFEVDDVDAVRDRLTRAGYRDTTVDNRHPHRRRVYFSDSEGNDWEFIEYTTDDPGARHDYTLPDRA